MLSVASKARTSYVHECMCMRISYKIWTFHLSFFCCVFSFFFSFISLSLFLPSLRDALLSRLLSLMAYGFYLLVSRNNKNISNTILLVEKCVNEWATPNDNNANAMSKSIISETVITVMWYDNFTGQNCEFFSRIYQQTTKVNNSQQPTTPTKTMDTRKISSIKPHSDFGVYTQCE